jgi:hypothetical protein
VGEGEQNHDFQIWDKGVSAAATDAVQRAEQPSEAGWYKKTEIDEATPYTEAPIGDADTSSSTSLQRDYKANVPDAGMPFPEALPYSGFPGDDVYQTDISALLGDQPPPTRRAQRREKSPDESTLADADDMNVDQWGEDMGGQSMDIYSAMLDAEMLPPAPADAPGKNFDRRATEVPSTFVQRTPEETSFDDDDMSQPPLDVFQAMIQENMIQPPPGDDGYEDAPDTFYPSPERTEPMPPSTRADLLNLLDNVPPPRPQVSRQPGGESAVARSPAPQAPEPPRQAAPPEAVQRVESDADEPPAEDVNVDQLARDVYSVLRNRLRIERERRDRKS